MKGLTSLPAHTRFPTQTAHVPTRRSSPRCVMEKVGNVSEPGWGLGFLWGEGDADAKEGPKATLAQQPPARHCLLPVLADSTF